MAIGVSALRGQWNAARRAAVQLAAAGGILLALVAPSAATDIQRIVSPGGIEVWLVRETSLPLIAIDYAFRGGSTQDPAGKSGLASIVADLLDEGAGDIVSHAFHEQLESYAINISFAASRDQLGGSLRTLVEHQDKAVELLRLALTAPRFDAEPVERVRNQTLAGLRRATTNPSEIASDAWWKAAFPGHPYALQVNGSLETVPGLTVADMKGYAHRILARDNLKIGIVGNVDAENAGKIVDRIFGDLPAKADLAPVATVEPQGIGRKIVVDLDVPQSVILLGHAGIARNDRDFMAAYVLNHILGGGAMSSRLYREVREVRGLVYSVYTGVYPLDYSALFIGSTATRADRTDQTLDVMNEEFRRMAERGPTPEEFADAKSFLKGSYALRFDTSSKIASQLVQIQLDDLGIDYIAKRNSMVDAVTLDDLKRVAKRLLDGGMLVAVVGRPTASQSGAGGAPTTGAPAKRDGG